MTREKKSFIAQLLCSIWLKLDVIEAEDYSHFNGVYFKLEKSGNNRRKLEHFRIKTLFLWNRFRNWSAHLDELLPDKATKATVNKGNGHENIDALYEASD